MLGHPHRHAFLMMLIDNLIFGILFLKHEISLDEKRNIKNLANWQYDLHPADGCGTSSSAEAILFAISQK